MKDNRRQRLIKFIASWRGDKCDPQHIEWFGRCEIRLSDLTIDALERVASQYVDRFWFTRRLNRENRRQYAEARRA